MYKSLKKISFIVIILLVGVQTVFGSTKREFRAAWIATVGNIDWPSKKGLTSQQQQQEFIKHLDFLHRNGFNAVFVQIRPAADAFYPTPYEPWSQYLTGKQGQPPFPKYDPLAFMIEETHKRNMEFHAWFNPFRALVSTRNNPNPSNHPTRTQPDWIINYAGKGYFDPGMPSARNYILNVIMDVVKRYDIDGVHIDDYFYPYKVAGQVFNDQKSFQNYNVNQLSLEDWRRNNVNLFISQLYYQIKQEKKWVKFGVSPFGIWRNQKQDPTGSATNGTSCYDDLYSDVKLWMEKKWMDYVLPQLYWEHGHRLAAYDVLLPWWNQIRGDRHLYIGLGVYRMLTAKPNTAYYGPTEILNQITSSREEGVQGVSLYSISNFEKIPNHLEDSLRYTYFKHIAIPPPMPWLESLPPARPIVSGQYHSQGVHLNWVVDNPKEERLRFLIYRFPKHVPINLTQNQYIIGLTQNYEFWDYEKSVKGEYKYVVTTLDRLWNESAATLFE